MGLEPCTQIALLELEEEGRMAATLERMKRETDFAVAEEHWM